jgi:hypothetical protein
MHPTGQRRHAQARSAPRCLRMRQAARHTHASRAAEPHTGGGSHIRSHKGESGRRGRVGQCGNHNIGQR